jgi:hypothetical protein
MQQHGEEVIFVVRFPNTISHVLVLKNRKSDDRFVVLSSRQIVGHNVELTVSVENIDGKLTEELIPQNHSHNSEWGFHQDRQHSNAFSFS